MCRSSLALATAVLISFVAPSASAVDGVLEINQACAAGPGCFSGDTAGFPVQITVPGSYRLTSNLTPGPGLSDAIALNSAAVVLDLNGFSILGGTACSETGAVPNVVSCTPGGNFVNGISGSVSSGVAISGGAIVGMRERAILLPTTEGVSLANLGLVSNGGNCVEVGDRASLANVGTTRCGGAGIVAGQESGFAGVRATACDGNGIEVGRSAGIREFLAMRNVADGVNAGDQCIIVDGASNSNGDDGIEAGASCMVLRNSTTGNVGFGVRAGSDTGYGRNALTGNTGGTATGGVTLLDNVCTGTTC